MTPKPFETLKLNKKQFDYFYESLRNKGLVRVSKIGVFTIRRMKPRRFYHNYSDRQIVSSGRNKLHFRPFTKTKEKIKDFSKYYVPNL